MTDLLGRIEAAILTRLDHYTSEDIARAVVAEIKPSDVLELMRAFTDDERKEIMSGGEVFCRYCGSDNPRCQCWNDE